MVNRSCQEVVLDITGMAYASEAEARAACLQFLRPITTDGLAECLRYDKFLCISKERGRKGSPLPHEERDHDFLSRLATYPVEILTQQRGIILGPEPMNYSSLGVVYFQPLKRAAAPPPPPDSLVQVLSCCVCLEVMDNPTTLDCGHSGCLKCISTAVERLKRCPSCRAAVSGKRKLTTSVTLRNTIDEIFPKYVELTQLRNCPMGSLDMNATLCRIADAYKLTVVQSADGNTTNSSGVLMAATSTEGVPNIVLCSYDELMTTGNSSNDRKFSMFSINRLIMDKHYSSYVEYKSLYEWDARILDQVVDEKSKGRVDSRLNLPRTLLVHFLSKLGDAVSECNADDSVFLPEICDAVEDAQFSQLCKIYINSDFSTTREMEQIFRKAGSVFEGLDAIECLRNKTMQYLDSILKYIVEVTEHARRKTVTLEHVQSSIQHAKNRHIVSLVGYGGRFGLVNAFMSLLHNVHRNLSMDEVSASVLEDIVSTLAKSLLNTAASLAKEKERFTTKSIIFHDWPNIQALFGDDEVDRNDICVSYKVFVQSDFDSDEESKGSNGEEGTLSEVIDKRCVLYAMKMSFPYNLARLAHLSTTTDNPTQPLVFDKEIIGLMVGKYFNITECSIDYLTAVLECVASKLVKVAGREAKRLGLGCITPRCIKLGIEKDKDLSQLLKDYCIRDGGVSSFIPPSLAAVADCNVSNSADSVKEYLLSVASTQGPCIDPFSGHFIGIAKDTDSSSRGSLVRCDVLDVLADTTLVQRQLHMLSKLPENIRVEAEAQAMDPMREWQRRLADVKHEQLSVGHIFDLDMFHYLVRSIGHYLKTDLRYTAEAVEAIMTLTEDFLVSEARAALRIALLFNRKIVLAQDFKVADAVLARDSSNSSSRGMYLCVFIIAASIIYIEVLT